MMNGRRRSCGGLATPSPTRRRPQSSGSLSWLHSGVCCRARRPSIWTSVTRSSCATASTGRSGYVGSWEVPTLVTRRQRWRRRPWNGPPSPRRSSVSFSTCCEWSRATKTSSARARRCLGQLRRPWVGIAGAAMARPAKVAAAGAPRLATQTVHFSCQGPRSWFGSCSSRPASRRVVRGLRQEGSRLCRVLCGTRSTSNASDPRRKTWRGNCAWPWAPHPLSSARKRCHCCSRACCSSGTSSTPPRGSLVVRLA
mmetsp:Transcript_18893/g.52015  ORF Transcript_18893/g.52015 Transcript_18893/m.52015 type:complete len:254 (-) Transcript_18893:366-1127(-)